MIIELTKEEAQQLIDLMDLATKTGGLQVAAVALPLAAKIMQAAQTVQNTPSEPQVQEVE